MLTICCILCCDAPRGNGPGLRMGPRGLSVKARDSISQPHAISVSETSHNIIVMLMDIDGEVGYRCRCRED